MMNKFQLYLLGFLTLFLELVLIRFLAGNIWNLGFFPNLVLLGVFVGMGIGFVFHHHCSERTSSWLFLGSVVLLLVLVLFVHFLHPVIPGFDRGLGDVGGELFYTAGPTKSDSSSVWALLLWFIAVVLIFSFITQRTAKLFRLFPPLTSYTLDIAGSCSGILAFMAASWLRLPAWSWFLLLIPMFLTAAESRRLIRWLPAPLLLLISLTAWHQDTSLLSDPRYSGSLEVRWSPYQKVEYTEDTKTPRKIYVNGIYHQNMNDEKKLARSFYQIPHRERERAGYPPYRNVLVIGAGSGNDVTSALMNGAQHVDAVEIDPVIASLGQKHHPAQPYSDPRVKLTINDARAFMTQAQQKYDLIIFALTDSLVKVSPMAQLRLENYIFTRESVQRAYSLLNPDGDLLFYNHYRKPWVLEKMQAMIHEATGKYPQTVWQAGDFGVLMVGPQRAAQAPPELGTLDIATDDWPFPYLQMRGIPDMYAIAMLTMGLAIALLIVVVHRSPKNEGDSNAGIRRKLVFVLMGVAFLLLETKSVIQFSLLFGTTWLNNSLVFLGVLVLVLLANWTAYLFRGRAILGIAYLFLISFCLAGYFYPLGNLLSVESKMLRFVFASLLTFSPIFFANLIFSVTFRDQKVAEHLFGWNLIGATMGGVLEYSSLAFGYGALALVVAACYSGVILLLSTERRSAPNTALIHVKTSADSHEARQA